MNSPLGALNFIVPLYKRSGLVDVDLRFVTNALKSSELLNRLTTKKTIELGKPDAHYRNLMALHKNVTRKLKVKYYGRSDKPADTFAKCKSPTEIYHLKRRTETAIAHTMHRYGFIVNEENKAMLKGEDFPEIPMFLKFVHERRVKDKVNFVSFRLLESFISVHEWYKNGIAIEALDKRLIRPVYSVWPPTSQGYINLLAKYITSENLSSGRALDIGSGTGVLSLVLASKGLSVTAIDCNKSAVECTRINALAMGMDMVEAKLADVTQDLDLPKFDVIVSNPPWLPGAGGDPLIQSVYDDKGQMLKACIRVAAERLEPQGRFLLIYSDLAQRLGLQPANYIESLCEAAGLRVAQKLDEPFPKQINTLDPLKPLKDTSVISLYDIRSR